MPKDLYVEVIGADQLRRIIGEANAAFEKRALVQANKKAAELIAKKALPNVPVGKTGRLKQSVKVLASPMKANVKAGSAGVPYAAAIHWGRGSGAVGFKHGGFAKGGAPIQGRPFLWNAKNEAYDSGELADVYDKACNDMLNDFF